jgi:hypothetical protein
LLRFRDAVQIALSFFFLVVIYFILFKQTFPLSFNPTPNFLVATATRTGRGSGGEKLAQNTFTGEISYGDFTGCQKVKHRCEIYPGKGKIGYSSPPQPRLTVKELKALISAEVHA